MPTTADYLNNLLVQRDNLADNLVAKGVTASKTELLDTLVPKVLQIEGGGSNGLNIFTQMAEPDVKEGIWLETENTYNRVVVDSSTFLSGTKLTSSDTAFPQHTGTLVSEGGYYHPATNSIYSFARTTGTTAKLNLYKYDLTAKTYTQVGSYTVGTTFDVVGAVIIGDDLYCIIKSSTYNLLSKFNLINYVFTSIAPSLPYHPTTYGNFLNSSRVSPLMYYDGYLYIICTDSAPSTTDQEVFVAKINPETGVSTKYKTLTGIYHNTRTTSTTSASIKRAIFFGNAGRGAVIQYLIGGVGSTTESKAIERSIRAFNLDSGDFAGISQTASLWYEPTFFNGNNDFGTCAFSDNRIDVQTLNLLNTPINGYSHYYMASTTVGLSTSNSSSSRLYHSETVDKSNLNWAYISNLNQLWGFVGGVLVYAYTITSKQYADGDFVLIRSHLRTGTYLTVLVSTSDTMIPFSESVAPFLRLCVGFDNAYIFKDGNLLAPTAYYGDGTQWVKFRA